MNGKSKRVGDAQNPVAYDSGLDTILSEARKFGVSVVSANQFPEQYPHVIGLSDTFTRCETFRSVR